MKKENEETFVLERKIKELNEQFNQFIINKGNQENIGSIQSFDTIIFGYQQKVIKRLTEENKELKEQIMEYQSFIEYIKQSSKNIGK